MRHLDASLILPLAALSATAATAGLESPTRGSDAAKCSLMVSFGSYAMGIDRGAAAAVERLLAGDPGVTSVTRRSAGWEGEYSLCVTTDSGADALRLFDAVRARLPARPRGPITVRAGPRRASVPR